MVVIETERLRLRPVVAEDAPVLAALLYSNAEVTRYLPPSEHTPEEQAERLVRFFCDHWTQHGFGEWIVEERVTGETLGQVGVLHIPGGEIEIDYALAQPAWGRGIAGEAAAAVVSSADTTLQLPEIVGFVLPGNTASERVLLRLGFEPQGARDQWGVQLNWFKRRRPESDAAPS